MSRPAISSLRLALAGMAGMAVAMGIGRFAYTPILPGMMSELGLSPAQAGFIASSNYAGYLAGAILAAGAWGQGRERQVLLAGLAATAVLAAAMGLTESVAAFAAIRFLAGIASAFALVFLSTLVFEGLAAAKRRDLDAVHFAGVGLGIALSSLLMMVLFASAAAWWAAWLWSGALSGVGVGLVAMLLPPTPRAQRMPTPEPKLPRRGPFARLIVAYGLFGVGYVVTMTFLIAIVRQSEGGRPFEALVWLVAGLSGLPSVYLWNRVVDRFGPMPAYAFACLIEALGVAASVAIAGPTGLLLAAVLVGGTFIGITAIGLQAARQLASRAPRRALAVMTAAFGIGQIAGPVAAGIIAQGSGSFAAPSLGAALALLASAAIAWQIGRGPKSP